MNAKAQEKKEAKNKKLKSVLGISSASNTISLSQTLGFSLENAFKTLVVCVPMREKEKKKEINKYCFSAKEAITVLCDKFLLSKNDSLNLCQMMVEKKWIEPLADSKIKENANLLKIVIILLFALFLALITFDQE